jgi:pimeloyl-ACP methyl ester carboxylesterase
MPGQSPDQTTEILILHGALGSATQMRPIAEALDALGRTRVLEFPGHGATPLGDAAFTLDAFADWLDAQLGDSRPMVFGYSMGGYVALTLEARRPGRFAAITTLGTKFEWTPENAAREGGRLNPAVIAEKVPKFAAVLAARHERAGGWEPVVVRTAALLRAAGEAPLLDDAMLGRVHCPVTLAVGSADDTVDLAETTRVAAHLALGTARSLEGVGHPIERVPVELVVALVREMLERATTGR